MMLIGIGLLLGTVVLTAQAEGAGKSAECGAVWRVETESIPLARKHGLSKQRLKPGTTVTVRGWPARKGKAALGLKSVTFPGGKTVTMRKTAR